ncbi:MAG: hypothetical protein QXD70_03610 [Candidatus Bathyarchaeia archaeon]
MEINVSQEIRRYVFQNYGNLISVGEAQFDEKTRTWVAELRSDYPRIIHDDRSPRERMLKFLSLRRLGTVRLGENHAVEATSRDECVKNLSSFLAMWQERAERIIVRASSDNLARINEAQWVLAKVGMIISNLSQKEIILESELESRPERESEKIRRYLRLLEGLDLVRHVEEGYTYGNLFVELRGRTGSLQEFKVAVLSLLIRERYSALKELFGIAQLEPFVHVDSCYYMPALEAERILYWTQDSIIDYYNSLYGRKSPLRLRYIIGELVEVGALKHEDKYYFADERLFSQMLDMKSEMAEIAPVRA